MIQQFANREIELEFLERKYSESSAQLVIIYGRRRVGKTELIKKFIQKKDSLYFLCTRDSLAENIKEIKRKFYELTGKEYFLKLDTNSLLDLFKYLLDEIEDKKLTIIFDEFPYLIELERGITSVFQKIWDEQLKDKKIFLVLSGSSIGMMETEVLGYRSPLYGRRTGEWRVEPFRLRDIADVFKKYSTEEHVKIWSVFGGTPFYLTQVNHDISVEENIKERILKKGEVLYNEPRILLKEEFREPKTYTLILKYLSLGYNSQGELSSACGIEKGNLSKYLSVLEETQLIKHVLPLGQRKGGIYVINDPFFNFWFRFVYPNLSDLEIGLVDETLSRINQQINSYYGLMFEQLVSELIMTKDIQLPLPFNEVRRWWHKGEEVDVVALHGGTKEIAFFECKWGNVGKRDAERIISDLKRKATVVQWHNDKRKERYGIIAKRLAGKEELRSAGYFAYDLDDLERQLR